MFPLPRHTSAPAQQGFVLIAVLGMIMLLSLIATFIAGYAEQRVQQAQELQGRWQQQLDEQSLLAKLQFWLATGGRYSAGWAVNDHKQPLFLTADGQRYQMANGTVFALQDEGALLSLMEPDLDRWQQLLAEQGLTPAQSEQFLDQLRDYTDKDDLRRLNGATKVDYLQRGLAAPPQRFMISPGQVFNLLNAEQWRPWLQQILPLITARSGQAQNLNTMPEALLTSLPSVNQPLAEQWIAERNKAPFSDLADANLRLGKLLPLDAMSMPSIPTNFVRVQIWPQADLCQHATWIGLTLTPSSTRAPWEIDYVFNYRHAQSCSNPVALAATAFNQ